MYVYFIISYFLLSYASVFFYNIILRTTFVFFACCIINFLGLFLLRVDGAQTLLTPDQQEYYQLFFQANQVKGVS